MTEPALAALLAELRDQADLDSISAILDWDQATYLPEDAAPARGRQLALLSELSHARRASPKMRDMLGACRSLEDSEGRDALIVRRARERYERAARTPPDLVRALKENQAAMYVAWTKARPLNSFEMVRPLLEESVTLSRRLADALGFVDHPLDALMHDSDRGATVASMRALFGSLRAALVPVVRAIVEAPPADDSVLKRVVPADEQLRFASEVARALGYDFRRGRMDLTHHPFMTRLGVSDIRITTRVREDDFGEAFYSTVHEVGHALYEQGINPALDGTPLGEGASSGIHESQSRFWENFIGRRRAFWEHFLPKLAAAQPAAFGDVSVDSMYRAVNHVSRSLIRTDADEVTYNLHVMLRFGLETDVYDGTLRVADLPEAWNERMERDLGVRPADDRSGVLQDVHWYASSLGGQFQGYTLGNLFAAQLAETAERMLPHLDAQIAQGDFTPVHGFLADRVHRHGASMTPAELIESATGAPLGIDAFIRHVKRKYGALYGLDL